MSQFYMQRDADGFGAKLATVLTADDDATKWIMVTIATDNDIDFKQNFQRYQIHDDGTVVRGGDNATTIEDVNKELADALDTIKAQAEQLKQLNTLLPQVQQMVVASTKAQAESTATQNQFKTMMVEMSKTLAQMQAAQSTTTTTN